MQNHDHEGLIACCKRLGDSGSGGDPSLWADLLKYFGELGEDCSKEVKEVLTYIERNDILPPIIVLQTLSQNPCLTLSVIKGYIARKLEQESKRIEEDRQAIEKYQEDTSAMRKEIEDLRTNARIFQLSKCTACTFTLDLPAVHFMCMHSFHQRCLGDNEKECPECAPEYRSVLEMKRSLEQNSKDQDRFFQKVRSAKDGFSVIAEYFGKAESDSILCVVDDGGGGVLMFVRVLGEMSKDRSPEPLDFFIWTVEDVGLWLEEINLGSYRQIFKENGVNGEYLEGMSMFTTEQILRFIRRCHMKWGDFITLCKELRRIKVACLKGEQRIRRPWWAPSCLSVVFVKAAKRNRQSRVVSLKLEP
ncbi:Vacuolar protein-sorting-associated protein 11-like protein [Drosera capensis]